MDISRVSAGGILSVCFTVYLVAIVGEGGGGADCNH